MALTNLQARAVISSTLNQSLNTGAPGTITEPLSVPGVNQAFGIGNGTANFNNGFCQQFVGNTTLNLSSTPNVTQIDGTTLPALTDIVEFTAQNYAGNGTITIGGGTDPITTIWGNGTITLPPGAACSFVNAAGATGFAITATTADRLTIVSSNGTNTLVLKVLGH